MAASAESDKRKDKGEARGFAGLALLVSDVDAILRSVQGQEALQGPEVIAGLDAPPAPTASAHDPGIPRAAAPEPSIANIDPVAIPVFSQAPTLRSPSRKAPGKPRRLRKLVAGIAVIALAIWLAGLIDDKWLIDGKWISGPEPAPTASTAPAAPTASPAPMAARPPDEQTPAAQDPADRIEAVRPEERDIARTEAGAASGSPAKPSAQPVQPVKPVQPVEPQQQPQQPAQAPPARSQEPRPQAEPEPDAATLAIQRRLRELDAGRERPQAGPDLAQGARDRATEPTQATTTQTPTQTPAQPLAQPQPQPQAPQPQPRATQAEAREPTETVAAPPVERSRTEESAARPPTETAGAPIEHRTPQEPATEAARAAAQTDVTTQLRNVSPFERISITMACSAQDGDVRQYERCLRQQLASLAASPGRPDLQGASRADLIAIENACARDKRESGPARYYDCLRREGAEHGYGEPPRASAQAPAQSSRAAAQSPAPAPAAAPARPSAQSILAGTSAFERASIEKACAQQKNGSDPSNYDSCLRWQMVNLSRSGGRPDLSRATSAEVIAVENACAFEKNQGGPVRYYDCLRNEMTRLGVQ